MNKDAVAEISQQYQVEAAKKLVPEGYKQTEVGVIPEDWKVVTLGTVGEIKMCKRIFKNQTKDVAEVPFYKIGTFGREPDAFISKELFDEYRSKYSYPKTGEILISAAGTIGRTVIFDGQPSYFQDSNIIWISNDEGKVLNSYLWHYYKVVKWSTSEGGIVSRLYNDNIRNNVFIAYPATTEQKEIAAALSDTEALVSELEKLIAKKQAIKTATMQQLLTGRTRLSQFAHHPDGSKKGYKQSELGEIPEDWEVISFDEVAQRINTKKNQISASDYQSYGSYPVVDQGKKKIVGYSDLECKVFTVSDAGVIVFGDHTCIVKYVDFSFLVGADGVQVILGREGFNTRFLFYVMSFFPVEPTGYNRHYGALREFVYSFPKQEEQTTIATILSDMDKEIQALEQRLNKTRQIKQGMMQQLLTGKVRLV